MRELTPHPAKFSDVILDAIGVVLQDECDRLGHEVHVLDPFAGVGKIHKLKDPGRILTTGVELEPEWAEQHILTLVGNSLHLDELFVARKFNAIATSCTYGNRMADSHIVGEADKSKRMTYTHQIGRQLHEDNSGKMQWGPAYREFHEAVWRQCDIVLTPGGLFILNVKNFYRTRTIKGKKVTELVDVSKWHVDFLIGLGYRAEIESIVVPTRGMSFGANGSKRVNHEMVHVLRKEVR